MKRMLIVVCIATGALLVSGAVALATDSGHQGGEIHVYGVNPTGGMTNQILITGAIAARGTTSSVSENIGLVTTPQGTFEVNLTKINRAPGTAVGINRDTCSGAFTETEPIELFDGTGAYAGIHGTVRLTTTYAAIASRSAKGTCEFGSPTPLTALSFFEGAGKVEF